MKRLTYTYLRVSTKRQGKHGYGLLAQRQAVEVFARANNLRLGKVFIEIESGRKKRRPVLERAITTCKNNHGLLLIAKLDRLSRNVAFTAALLESGVEFKAVDNPTADKFTIHILAAVAQKEAEDISQRTKAALQVAKSKGVELGRFGKEELSIRKKEAARRFYLHMHPTLYRLEKQGVTTVRGITEELNRRGVPTFYGEGHKWHPATVHHLIKAIKQTS